jgi:hypothetical protein
MPPLVKVGPLPSSPKAPHLPLFLPLIQQLDIVLSSWPTWAPLELSRAPFLASKGSQGPQQPSGPFYFDSFFLPFFKKQTASTFAFTALSQAASFLGPFLGPFLGRLGTLLGPPRGPPGPGAGSQL